MRPNTITAVNPRAPFDVIRQSAITGVRKQGGFVDNSISSGSQFLKTGFGLGVKVAKIIFGFLGLVGGAVAAAIFKENTAADWGSKILMIAGAILGVLGVRDLLSFNKSLEEKIQPEKCFTEVSDSLGKSCRNAIIDLGKQENDPHFADKYDPSNPGNIRTNKADPNVRKAAVELLKLYTNKELIDHAATYTGGVEYHITNIDNKPLSLSDFGDRIVMLLGYIYASGPLDTSDPDAKALVENILNDVDNRANPSFNYELSGNAIAKVLPTDFRDAYFVAKWYKNNHFHNNVSIMDLIGGVDKVQLLNKCLTTEGVGATSKDVKDYLTNLQQTQNYLTALDRIINYVHDPRNLSDPAKARNVIVLRQALICGFGLKSQNLDAVNLEFLKVLKGEEPSGTTNYLGLENKLQNLTSHIDSQVLLDFFRNERCPYTKNIHNITGDDVLGSMVWYEIVRKHG